MELLRAVTAASGDLYAATEAAGERVLAVDPRPSMLESLHALATLRGLPLDTAETTAEARKQVAKRDYGIALVDLRATDPSGPEFMDWLRRHQPKLDVIALTAEPGPWAPTEALRCGATEFVRKPFDPEALFETLDEIRQRSHVRRRSQTECEQATPDGQFYRLLADRSPDLIYVLDADGCFTFVNRGSQGLLGFDPDLLLGQHYERVLHEADREHARHRFNERRTGARATRGLEVRLRPASPDAEPLVVDITAMGLYADSSAAEPGSFLGTYGVARDISERKAAEQLLQFQAYHDLLTGLPNRALLQDRLEHAVAQARRANTSVAILLLDLDRFKAINDSLGHAAGDHLLEQVARRLEDCIRDYDTLSRLGGDEFVLLLPDLPDPAALKRVADKCLAAMGRPFSVEGQELAVQVSIGAALFPDHGDDISALLKRADAAMYHAKEHHPGGYYLAGNQRDRGALRNDRELETALRQALDRDEFRVVYQPQVDVVAGVITGVEALLRWQHPGIGEILPMEFIPIAERSGLIVPIGEWLLRTACEEILRWPGGESLHLAVNLSPQQVDQADFVERITRISEATGLPLSRLDLEISEALILHDSPRILEHLQRLAHHGAKLAVDDFGTGQSSLSHLQRLPLHTLKIDRSLIQAIREGEYDGSLIEGIMGMARSLNLHVVAEGVETERQINYLRGIQCTRMQGYYFSHPLSSPDTQEVLGAWSA